MKSILIIDDEKNICSSLTYALEDYYKIYSTTNPSNGIDIIKNENINLVLLDLRLGKVDGLDVLNEIKKIDKYVMIIIMTAFGTIKTAVESIRNGAFTYLAKPLDIKELLITIEQALEYQNLNKKVEYLNKELKEKYSYEGIVGKSPAMERVYVLIDTLKDVDTNVLITGDSGTGKELVARAIHYSGVRGNENFVEINCAAIPDGLLESELFGHRKGAFTGADRDKMGKFEFADKGSILLDEIGDMSLNLQTKLLRVLEQKEFTPLGSNDTLKLNARIIASTNKDLKRLVLQDKFREDLYFRLNVVEINVPSLRKRQQDLPLLFAHFIQAYNKKLGKNIERLTSEAETILMEYSYPGNVRELGNIIEYGVLLSKGNTIDIKNLPMQIREDKLENSIYTEIDSLVGLSLKEVEKRVIKATLKLNKGHRKATAKILGISERGLRNKINEYRL